MKQENKERIGCNECDYSAATKDTMNKHMQRDHLGIRENVICNECDYSAGSKQTVAKH